MIFIYLILFFKYRSFFCSRTNFVRKTRFKATSLWRWKKRPSLSMRASVQSIFLSKCIAHDTLAYALREKWRQNALSICRDELAKRKPSRFYTGTWRVKDIAKRMLPSSITSGTARSRVRIRNLITLALTERPLLSLRNYLASHVGSPR